MGKHHSKFCDRAPYVNRDSLQQWRAVKDEAKADKESRARRKAYNRKQQRSRAVTAICTDEQFAHYQAECRKHGMALRRGSSDRPIHWMFEDAATGRRILNYYPKRKTGCFAKGKGFHVGDVNAAIDLASKQTPILAEGDAINDEYRQMFRGDRIVPLSKPTQLPEGFDAESAVAAEFAFL